MIIGKMPLVQEKCMFIFFPDHYVLKKTFLRVNLLCQTDKCVRYWKFFFFFFSFIFVFLAMLARLIVECFYFVSVITDVTVELLDKAFFTVA